MSNFKFKRTKNRFRWESNFMALEFSNPSIQGFNDYEELNNSRQIMYYYYTIKLYKKFGTWDKNHNEMMDWKLVSKRRAYDFPCITELECILNLQLKDDTKINGQKNEYRDGDIDYRKTMSTGGFACDDFYEITKIVDDEDDSERYIVYAGTTYDFQGDKNSVGIRTPYVEREDIEEFLKCVQEFIKYSLEKHNENNKKYKDLFIFKDNKIYEYENGDMNKLERIHVIEDNLDEITVVANNEEREYREPEVIEINDKSIKINNGEVINLDTIVYIANYSWENERVHYKEDQIADDFINILSDDELEEFRNDKISKLFNKYGRAIINRSAMCRDEHGFDMDYHSGDPIKEVKPIVKKVIKMIKDKLN
ncbi:hypothetical protein G6Z34_13835 [Clostridium perfringens]|uniref:Uncharacterized protein n=1 Tax=Clostridium perfringens TaxID=1502 RepID=A0AAP6WRG2_CLOPF|nr:hypothetical protein [Clostridium perfringens]NGU31166.1 hypothetical protein [Clostridium perfringens]